MQHWKEPIKYQGCKQAFYRLHPPHFGAERPGVTGPAGFPAAAAGWLKADAAGFTATAFFLNHLFWHRNIGLYLRYLWQGRFSQVMIYFKLDKSLRRVERCGKRSAVAEVSPAWVPSLLLPRYLPSC